VEGSLVVYAYDDTGAGPMQTPPTRKFVFPAEQLNEHYSESMLGHSYSFWLPWDKVGGEPRHISLIARFEPLKGPPIKSEITRHILPGIPTESYDEPRDGSLTSRGQSGTYFADANQMPLKNYRRLFDGRNDANPAGGFEHDGGIQPVSYEAPADDSVAFNPASASTTSEMPRDGMSTITIDIPQSFAQQTVLGGQQSPETVTAVPGGSNSFPAQPTQSSSYLVNPRLARQIDDSQGRGVNDPPRRFNQPVQLRQGPAATQRFQPAAREERFSQGEGPQPARFGQPLSPARVGPTPRPGAYPQRSRLFPSTSPDRSSHSPALQQSVPPQSADGGPPWSEVYPTVGE
jgi:hypothetical protein